METYLVFEDTPQGRELARRRTVIEKKIAEQESRQRQIGFALNAALAEQADAYQKHAVGEVTEEQLDQLALRVERLSRECSGNPLRARGLEDARMQIRRDLETARESYAASLAPPLNKTYHAAVEKLAKCLAAAADANAVVDHVQREMAKHGVAHVGACFAGLSWSVKRSGPGMFSTVTEFGRWCTRLASRGFAVPDHWRTEAEVATDAVNQLTARDTDSFYQGVNTFNHALHEPLRSSTRNLINRVSEYFGIGR